MNFWLKHHVYAATRYLRWHYKNKGVEIPGPAELERRAETLIADARRIAKRTGRNVLSIVKDLINKIKMEIKKS